MRYQEFLEAKSQTDINHGFDPIWMPDFLFDFQKELTGWAIKKGKAALFEDCGLGKTIQQLVWAQNVVMHTNKPVLVLTPLAVAAQTVREGDRFGVECQQSRDGKYSKKIVVTNYQRLHYFDRNDFAGVVCDESSAIKNFSGQIKSQVTAFMRKIPYRLLCTATAAPNDYIELGTSSEALGELGYMDMLHRFFKNDTNTCDTGRKWASQGGGNPKWRFKRHAEKRFWQWVSSWARAIRRPSDMGYDDGDFILPPMDIRETVVKASRPMNGRLFVEPARSLAEQREERKLTINERCAEVAQKVNGHHPALVWCQYNNEADLIEKMIPDAVQIKGSDKDDKKEGTFLDFVDGNLRVLVTKPKIGAFGLNFQHCSHMTFFPSHSWEQFYQGTRRCWRFGQKNQVKVDIITTEGEFKVLENLQRKAKQADRMFDQLMTYMHEGRGIKRQNEFTKRGEVPAWLQN